MTTYIKAKKLKGFQDIDGSKMRIKNHLIESIQHQAELAGFAPLDTPSLEYSETLLGVSGETDKQVYRFKDLGDRDVSLRFDLTIPFARYVAENHGKLPLPFKRYQIGKVWRAEKPQKGRYREFSQCDLDIIGVDTIWADIEIISSFANILSIISPLPVQIILGHRNLVSALIRAKLGSMTLKKEQELLIVLDKINKIGKETVIKNIVTHLDLEEKKVVSFLDTLTSDFETSTTQKTLEKTLENDAPALLDLQKFTKSYEHIKNLSPSKNIEISVDLSTVRGLGYYTGIVFESLVKNHEHSLGSICSGGRYDRLTSRFLNQSIPGVGGSIGIDRLIFGLENEFNKIIKTKNKIMVVTTEQNNRSYALNIVKTLRTNNFLAEFFLKDQKISQQFRFASKNNYHLVITVGEEEIKTQSANLKNMQTKKELKKIPIKDLISKIKEENNSFV